MAASISRPMLAIATGVLKGAWGSISKFWRWVWLGKLNARSRGFLRVWRHQVMRMQLSPLPYSQNMVLGSQVLDREGSKGCGADETCAARN